LYITKTKHVHIIIINYVILQHIKCKNVYHDNCGRINVVAVRRRKNTRHAQNKNKNKRKQLRRLTAAEAKAEAAAAATLEMTLTPKNDAKRNV